MAAGFTRDKISMVGQNFCLSNGLSKTNSDYENKMSLKSEETSLNVDFLETFDLVFLNRPVATCIERTMRGELTFHQSCLVGRRIDYRFSFIEPGHARIFIRLPSTDFRSKRASRGPDC